MNKNNQALGIRGIQFVLVVSVLALLIWTGCTKKGAVIEARSPIKIGFVLATMNEERYAKDRDYFLEAAKAKGYEVEFASCNDKVDVQTAKVETLLSKKIRALVIQPVNGETASAIVQLAKREGVPVVSYDRLIRNADIDLYVTQDSFQVGVLQAEEAVRVVGDKGNYVILMGEAGHSVADEITRGNMSVLEKYPGIQVVVKQNHPKWSTALALATVENALTRQQNKIDAILANNDGMALGATQALTEQKLTGKVFVAGADADLAAIKNIVTGKQTMTVLKGIRPLAEAAVLAAGKLARGEAVASDAVSANGYKNVPVVNTPVSKVTNALIQKEIIESGFHTAQAVYGTPGI